MPKELNVAIYTTTVILITLTASCSNNEWIWTLDYPINFNAEIQYDSIIDIEGNVYKTIQINDKWWMAQNLASTVLNDGESISNATDENEWASLDQAAYCWYENDHELFGETYGGLYNWYAIESEKLCPDGWHVPSDLEWSSLVEFIGGINNAGTKLREIGDIHWSSSESMATNEYGFTAIPGGVRFDGGLFAMIGAYGYWWTSTRDTVLSDWAIHWYIPYGDSAIHRNPSEFNNGYSVRCVHD